MIRHLSTASDRPVPLLVATAGAVLLCAGLLWLNQSSALATTGQRLYTLDRERQALLEQRSEALLAYAEATDPRRVAARAADLGFRPQGTAQVLTVNPSPDADRVAGLADDSALAIVNTALVRANPPDMTLTERLLAGSLVVAAADSREPPRAIGSAP